jgi:hypothetical protein
MLENTKPNAGEISVNYCSVCGKSKDLPRVNGTYVFQEIRAALSFEKGFLFTIRELVINPGKSVQDFLKHDRHRLMKPIVFLFLCSLIYTVVNSIFLFEDQYISYSGTAKSATTAIFNWVQQHYGYANIIMALFIGVWLRLFFRKQDVNFFEILVLLCFVMGMGMLIYSIFGAFQGFSSHSLLEVASMVGFVYVTWSIGQFYGNKFSNYAKAFFAYLLGMLSFTVLAIWLGYLLDKLA